MITAISILFAASLVKAISIQDEWNQFKVEYGKVYESLTEEENRKKIFTDNLKLSELRNKIELENGGTAVFGATKFSDLTPEEFQAKYFPKPIEENHNALKSSFDGVVDSSAVLVDWTAKYTTAVKNQDCGNCWAYSGTEQVESDTIRMLGLTYVLSAQQMTDCAKTDGCNGGNAQNVFDYIMTAGIEKATDYPTVLKTCKANSSKFVPITVSSYYKINAESSQGAYVQATGPLSSHICGSDIQSYKSGIITSCPVNCSINHAIQKVGVYPATTGGYWKIRNSWGSNWGESGFLRVAYGSNMCGVAASNHNDLYVAVKKK